MSQNVFLDDKKTLTLDDFMKNNAQERDNLGDQIPVTVYRLMEYAIREVLEERFGKEAQESVFREGGFRAGEYFAKNFWILHYQSMNFWLSLAESWRS